MRSQNSTNQIRPRLGGVPLRYNTYKQLIHKVPKDRYFHYVSFRARRIVTNFHVTPLAPEV